MEKTGLSTPPRCSPSSCHKGNSTPFPIVLWGEGVLCKMWVCVCVCVCLCVCLPMQNIHKTFGPKDIWSTPKGLETVSYPKYPWAYLVHAQRRFFFLISFYFSKFLLQLLYNVVLVSNVQQSESALCIHMYPLGGIPSHCAQRFWTGPDSKNFLSPRSSWTETSIS